MIALIDYRMIALASQMYQMNITGVIALIAGIRWYDLGDDAIDWLQDDAIDWLQDDSITPDVSYQHPRDDMIQDDSITSDVSDVSDVSD